MVIAHCRSVVVTLSSCAVAGSARLSAKKSTSTQKTASATAATVPRRRGLAATVAIEARPYRRRRGRRSARRLGHRRLQGGAHRGHQLLAGGEAVGVEQILDDESVADGDEERVDAFEHRRIV